MKKQLLILISAIVVIAILVVSFVGIPPLLLNPATEITPTPSPTPTPTSTPTPTQTPTQTPTPTPEPTPTVLVDSDGDGVPDELERNGYYYKDGKFQQWNGDPSITYYRTDPTQWSTDQDPYSDGMEVSGVKMDVSVTAPGNHPMVPGYPDIYVSLAGFDVTPISPITTSKGGTLETSWSNEFTSEKTTEHYWEISASAEASLSITGPEAKVSVTATAGGKYGSKHSVTSSDSGLESTDWNEATTVNPARAGTIKLTLQFENRGTATCQNIIPTINMILGDKTIVTHTMLETNKILELAPTRESGNWILGGDEDEITVTLEQLKSIQSGVPIFLDVPQIAANVLVQDEDGYWDERDDWQNYKARIDKVCARISVDLGDGNMKDYKVFARSDNGPAVTLRDALKWTVGCTETAGGVEIMGAPVGDWRIGFSENAFEEVKEQLADGGDILGLVLDAGWTITFKAPTGNGEPDIVWCVYIDEEKMVRALVLDDFEVSEVLFKSNLSAVGLEMEELWAGTGLYQLKLESDYEVTDKSHIIATNDRDKSATERVDVLKTEKPLIKEGVYVIASVNSNKVLSIDDADQTNVVQYNFARMPSQEWKVEYEGGYYTIKNNATISEGKTMLLEVYDKMMNDSANVQLNNWFDTDNDNQKWTLEDGGNGSYVIIALHSEKCLDIQGSSLNNLASAIQNTFNGSDSQKWILQPADSYPAVMPVRGALEEHFVILNKKQDTCLAVENNNSDGGDTVVQNSWGAGDNQKWLFIPVGTALVNDKEIGYFRICVKNSGLCLTAENNILILQPYAGNDNQKWRIVSHGSIDGNLVDFVYHIENKDSLKSLTSNESDMEVIQTLYNGGENQKWQLIPVERYSWVNNLAVMYDTFNPPEEGKGWNILGPEGGEDLNRDVGGGTWFIYLWVRGPNTDNIAVTNTGDSPTPVKPEGEDWVRIGGDLNQNVHGNYIWLWVRGPAMDNIAVTYGYNSKPDGEGWTFVGDLNAGTFFYFPTPTYSFNPIYLWIR